MDTPKVCKYISSFVELCSRAKARLDEFKIVKVVMGRPACDIDSVVSALVYALLAYEEVKRAKKIDTCVIPLLNISKPELCLKTDILFWMRCHHIHIDHLLTRSDLDLQKVHSSHNLELILVNHHELAPCDSSLTKSITEIYDHRTPDLGFNFGGRMSMSSAGSCASLIAMEVMARQPILLSQDVCHFLYGPILVETECLSANSARTSRSDLEIIEELDKRLNYTFDRKEIYEKLAALRPDVPSLSPAELLVKDMSIICGVPICNLPLLIQEYVKNVNAKEALNKLCVQTQSPVLMIMGLKKIHNVITRDLAVFSASEPAAAQQLIDCLKKCTKPVLHLQRVHSSIPGLSIFNQGNIEATRQEIIAFLSSTTIYIPPTRACKP